MTPGLLTSLRQKAATNSAQWLSFKSRLDGQLNAVIESGAAYQGDELSWIGDYALGYKVLQFKDPTTANKYADKALALMHSALQDHQKFGEYAQQYIGRGDGYDQSVPRLPNTNIVSLKVYRAPISVESPTRSSGIEQNRRGLIPSFLTYIKVSNTSDGPTNYVEGRDMQHSGDVRKELIDWSIATTNIPAAGAHLLCHGRVEFGLRDHDRFIFVGQHHHIHHRAKGQPGHLRGICLWCSCGGLFNAGVSAIQCRRCGIEFHVLSTTVFPRVTCKIYVRWVTTGSMDIPVSRESDIQRPGRDDARALVRRFRRCGLPRG